MASQPPPSSKPSRLSVADVCKKAKLSDEALALRQDDQTAEAFLGVLLEKEHYKDAVGFIANWLTKREAVWWGCLCAWHTCRPEPDPKVAAALQASVRWVQKPDEKNRRAAQLAGNEAGADTPAGAVALAAFFSEGSLSEPNLPNVPSPDHLTATTIAGAVRLASTQSDDSAAEALRQFLLAFEVAQGLNCWDQ